MVKFLLGIFTGIVLTFLFIGVVVLVAVAVGGAEPGIEQDSVLVVRLRGPVREHVPVEFAFGSWREKAPVTVLELRTAFEKAANDERIRAVALDCGGLQAGWAKAQEIRWAIEDFKESGKPVVAFLQVGGTIDYFVASVADEVYMPPEAFLDLKGLRAEVSFYKDTLAKLGIEAELERIGKYKAAAEPWERSSMSDAFREVVESVIDEVYGQLLKTVAPDRDMTPDELRAVIDTGPFIPEKAAEAGLVDALQYEDEFFDNLKAKLDLEEIHKVNLRRYRGVSLESLGLGGDHQIAVVYAVGSILRGEGDPDPFFGSSILGSDSFSRTLREVRDNEEIKAVVVRIDSPGGDAVASDQMWREMNLLQKKKPLVISMSDVAASGGYYIAMADAPIVAYPGTYTGSIGVFFGKLNLAGLYEKLGINKEVITRGRFAEIDADYRGFTEAERAKVREAMEAIYDSFVAKVAESRDREWEEIDDVAQGRVWMGSQAEEVGLVDELGGFERAIALAKEAAGLEEDDRVSLVTYPARKQFIDVLLEGEWMSRDSGVIESLRSAVPDMASWPALLQGGMLKVAPYSISVQ